MHVADDIRTEFLKLIEKLVTERQAKREHHKRVKAKMGFVPFSLSIQTKDENNLDLLRKFLTKCTDVMPSDLLNRLDLPPGMTYAQFVKGRDWLERAITVA